MVPQLKNTTSRLLYDSLLPNCTYSGVVEFTFCGHILNGSFLAAYDFFIIEWKVTMSSTRLLEHDDTGAEYYVYAPEAEGSYKTLWFLLVFFAFMVAALALIHYCIHVVTSRREKRLKKELDAFLGEFQKVCFGEDFCVV